jgi:Arc/MetJ-type ribon-helix-helix transcriptional regulator
MELPRMQRDADAAVTDAEREMFAGVLSELFLGVLADYEPQEWFDAAVDLLSRGAAPKMWESIIAAHAAGHRGDPRASAQAEAIDVLCIPSRKPVGPYDFPTELAVLVVGQDVASMVHTRTGNGIYTSPDEVVGSAMHALEFAENDPEGKRRLLRYALALAVADSEAGRLIPADVVFARIRDRARRRLADDR